MRPVKSRPVESRSVESRSVESRSVESRPRAPRGRWIWGVSGLLTVTALAFPGINRLIMRSGLPGDEPVSTTVSRTITLTKPVTGLDLRSFGAPVQVTERPGDVVQVTEMFSYDPADGGPPAVTQSVSDGRLTLADPACAVLDCSVTFNVIVPSGVFVTAVTEGGSVDVSGAHGANLNSDGAPVRAVDIDGPLTVVTEGEGVWLNGQRGPLDVDTDGGNLVAQNVAATTATVSTGGGIARIGFTSAPATALISTSGGNAILRVPRGSYSLTMDSQGGTESVGVGMDPAAWSSLTVDTAGGSIVIEPGS